MAHRAIAKKQGIPRSIDPRLMMSGGSKCRVDRFDFPAPSPLEI